jgi:DNA-binding LytR/AlgR family response regulator
MIRCVVIEDQAPAQLILQKYIGKTETVVLERIFTDVLEAKAYLDETPVDLIFLDINLPRISGIDFLRTEINPPLTVLTTAYSEFALECYQYRVADYLLKPFSYDRFLQAIDKVMTMIRPLQTVETQEGQMDKYVLVKASHELLKIKKEDIIFIQSDSDYTEVVTTSTKYLTSDSLKEWTAKLTGDFYQVHKSYIVNTAHVRKISQNKVHLTSEYLVPIGRVFKRQFLEQVVQVK